MDSHLVYALVNFAIYVGILTFVLRRPLKEFWATRAESLRVGIANARTRRAKAESEYTRLSSRVRNLATEIAELKTRMQNDGHLEKQRIIADAQEYADNLADATKRVSEQEVVKSRYRLRKQAAGLTVNQAERILTQQLNDADQERLAKEFLDKLASPDLQLIEGGLS